MSLSPVKESFVTVWKDSSYQSLEIKEIYFKDLRDQETVVFLENEHIRSTLSRVFSWIDSPNSISESNEEERVTIAKTLTFVSLFMYEISIENREEIKKLNLFLKNGVNSLTNVTNIYLKDLIPFLYNSIFREEISIIKEFEEEPILSPLVIQQIQNKVSNYAPIPIAPKEEVKVSFVSTIDYSKTEKRRQRALSNSRISDILAHEFANLFLKKTDQFIDTTHSLTEFQKLTLYFFFNILKRGVPRLFFQLIQASTQRLSNSNDESKPKNPSIVNIVNSLSSIFEQNWELLCNERVKKEELGTESVKELKEQLKNAVPDTLYHFIDSSFQVVTDYMLASKQAKVTLPIQPLSEDLTRILIQIIDANLTSVLTSSDKNSFQAILKNSFLAIFAKITPIFIQDYLCSLEQTVSKWTNDRSKNVIIDSPVHNLSNLIQRFFSDYLMGVSFDNVLPTTILMNSFITITLQPYTPKVIASLVNRKTLALTAELEHGLINFLKNLAYTFEHYSLIVKTAKSNNCFKSTLEVSEQLIVQALNNGKESLTFSQIALNPLLKLFSEMKPLLEDKHSILYEAVVAELPKYIDHLFDAMLSYRFKKAFIIRLINFLEENSTEITPCNNLPKDKQRSEQIKLWIKDHEKLTKEIGAHCKTIIKTLNHTVKVSGPVKVILKCTEKFNLFTFLEELMTESIMEGLYSFIFDDLSDETLHTLNRFLWKSSDLSIAILPHETDKISDEEVIKKMAALIFKLLYKQVNKKVSSIFIPKDTLKNLTNELSHELYAFVKNDEVFKLILTNLLCVLPKP